MGAEAVAKSANLDETLTREYNLVIDGVIEIRVGTEPKPFFDGLLDAVLEYVEKHDGVTGLSMSYEEYNDGEENGAADGEETA